MDNESELQAAVERVCWFDWSGNDPDACEAIDRLRAAATVEVRRFIAGKLDVCPCGMDMEREAIIRAFEDALS